VFASLLGQELVWLLEQDPSPLKVSVPPSVKSRTGILFLSKNKMGQGCRWVSFWR
jgi:hypothetical protein